MVAGGFLAQGFGPEPIAVAVLGFADEPDALAGRDFLFDATEVGPELVVEGDAQAHFFEVFVEAVATIQGLTYREFLSFWACCYPSTVNR